MEKNFYVRFDWAIKRLLRDKANFSVLEGLLTVLFNDKTKIVEILESESTPQVVVAEFVEPSKVRQETPPPVLKPRQSRENIQRDSETAMTIERQKEEEKAYRIADSVQLFNKVGRRNLLYWVQRFSEDVGRRAKDEEIKEMADSLSAEICRNLSDYIKSKALSELPA